MPAELPGFYFDAERNRYFPISGSGIRLHPISCQTTRESHKKAFAQKQVGPLPSPSPNARVLHLLQKREVGVSLELKRWDPCVFQRQYLEAQTSQPRVWIYGETNERADSALEQVHVAIQTCEGLKVANVLIYGGSNGWVGICEIVQSASHVDHERPYCVPHQLVPSDQSCSGFKRPLTLKPVKWFLPSSSKVTAIKKWERPSNAIQESGHPSALLTTLGSAAEGGALYIMNQNYGQDSWQRGWPVPLEISKCVAINCSVWTTTWTGAGKASLGTSKGVALVDLERASLSWIYRSKSDVLSQQCDSSGSLVLSGFRNGTISTFDLRMPSFRSVQTLADQDRRGSSPREPHPSEHEWKYRDSAPKSGLHNVQRSSIARIDNTFDGPYKRISMGSAICSMTLLRSDEKYLLTSAMNGSIQLWDRRLVDRGAVQSYEGNHNTHTMLQLGVDPTETLLASGGEDSTIRIWSIRSGKLLQTFRGLTTLATTICWPLMEQDHAWGMWLGSLSGVLYMHDGATT